MAQGLAQRKRHAAKRHPPAGNAEYREGMAHAGYEHWEAAIAAFGRAIGKNPLDGVYWLNLAHARMRCGQYDQGARDARRGAELSPGSEPALAVAAECLNAANRHAETIALFESRDLEQIADHHVHFQLGDAFNHVGRHKEAVDCFLAALKRKPDYMVAHVQLGNAFNRLQLHEQARECFKTAVAVGGDAVQLTSGMTFEDVNSCRWDHLAEDLPELLRLMEGGTSFPQPFQLLAQPSTRRQQLLAARGFARQIFSGLEPLPPRVAPKADSRIRLGYFSSDLHEHATAYLITQIFEHHDRSRFEVFAYSYGTDDKSPIRRRIERAVDRFVDVRELSNRGAAERIRDDGIDILMDLKGYTLAARNPVLAFRPSPIQVNYLGYPGTLGSGLYDYIIGDPVVTPLEHADGYAEKIAQLPACYQPNNRSRAIGPRPSRAECGLPEGGFVFCSFDNPYKITAPVFDIWCRLLRSVDGSVLWLYESNEQARRNLCREAQRRGVDPARIVWGRQLHQTLHLGRLQVADLVLDTQPVCAHTTASDALWAGVPVVTCPGQTFVSRVAASLLSAVDLPELIAPDLRTYEAMALAMARDPQRLQDLKARLWRNRDTGALFDSVRYTRDLEAAFERMQARLRAGQPPEHLAAQPASAEMAKPPRRIA